MNDEMLEKYAEEGNRTIENFVTDVHSMDATDKEKVLKEVNEIIDDVNALLNECIRENKYQKGTAFIFGLLPKLNVLKEGLG